MRRTVIFFIAAFLLSQNSTLNSQNSRSVDPMIGTAGHGHVFVGANVPGGMVMAGPTQAETGWDWCSGYHHSGSYIVGFAQTHLSGTGCSDLGDIALMPAYDDLPPTREGLAAPFRHETEEARPGYYRVRLDRGNILCEMTATERVAYHRYTFPRGSNNARIVIDLQNGIGDRLLASRLYQTGERTLAGYRISRGWVARQEVYFTIEFSRPIHHFIGGDVAVATFEVAPGESVEAKVGLSPVSEAGAWQNVVAELPSWDFEAVREHAAEAWEGALGRIRATFRSERERRIFYTAMYHALMAPQLWCDVNGDYMGADGRVRRGATFRNYTTWSLWDTYRALHPLETLIMRDHLDDYLQTLLHIYSEQGELPVWHLHSGETYCMVGCPGVIALADMLLKSPPAPQGGEDSLAWEAIKTSLMKTNRSLGWLQTLGYVPYDKGDGECVAKSLEYYIADWSAAQVAGRMGLKADSAYFYRRSMGYRKLFDPQTRCMRARDAEGRFRSLDGFNPCHQTADYTEGNAWQYAWLVPHDVGGLISLYPNEQAFAARLDSLFTAPSELNADANPDISGLIGQYAHGNEPSHHIIYLYNYVGQPWKTAQRVRQVMRELYTDQPDGLCGNEDVGQMSAWYILSAMGLYQVNPAGGPYILGSPIVETATLNVGEHRTFTITTHGGSDTNIYVQRVALNGKPYPYSYIEYRDIIRGGQLDFYMGPKPSKWGTEKQYRP